MFTLGSRGRVALAAVLTLGLLGAPTPASAVPAGVWHVAEGGTDAGDCLSDAPCATLEYVAQLVQAGDTVQLGAGSYPVGGATFDVSDVTYERSGPGEAKITVPGDSYGIQVGGDNVTFRNLTVSSSDDTIQGDTWGFTYTGTALTLDHMRVGHLASGVIGLGGNGITVTDSTFTDIGGSSIDVEEGLSTVTDSDFTAGGGIHVTPGATVVATGNVFRGNAAGDGGTGIYVDDRDVADPPGTVTGNRFSRSLEFGISGGRGLDAPNNWWGCNEGIDNAGCVANYDLSPESADPHLVLTLSASPNPFLTTGFSTVTASLISSEPEPAFVGGPVGTEVALSTTAGALDDTQLTLDAGRAQTALRNTTEGSSTVTATLDNASVEAIVEAEGPAVAQAISFTSTAPTSAVVGGTYTVAATGGESTQPVTFTIDESTADACAIEDATISFTGAGTCTVNADQAGEPGFSAAPQVQQSFTVGKAAQSISFTSTAPTSAVVGGTYTLTATGGASGNAVTFSVDATSTADACTIDDATVSFAAVGQCVINADQLGDASYTAAAQEQQTVAIGAAPVTSASLSPSSFAYDAVDAGTGLLPQSKTFTLTNTGDRDIAVQAPTLTGPDQADYAIGVVSCDATLEPDDQCTYVVTFAPVTVDATYDASAGLNVQYAATGDTDAPATATSALSGRVNEAPFDLGVDSSQVDFGSATVATATAPRTITFTNAGRRSVHPDTVSLTGPGSGSYAVTADSCKNVAVAPAGACSVTVGFTPAAVGVMAATLRIAHDGGAGAVDVALTGTGLAKLPVAVPSLKLDRVRAPVRCLTYGAATPKKSIALKTNAKASVRWAITKVRGSRALAKCPTARNDLKDAMRSGQARRAGAVTTNASGSARVRLTTVLPARVRKQMKPGLYQVAFVARNATGSSPKRVILIRVLKARR